MKNQEILSLYENLHQLNLKGVKFSYAVAKNIALLKPEVESLQKAIEQSEDFKKFEQERVELAKKHAKKNENGEPIEEKGQYIIEDKEAFKKDFTDLKEKNKEVVEAREEQIKEFNELLEKENEIKFHKISIKDVPEDITTVQMNQIYSLISEE
jgi:hypothetical protein